jgi:hypothetical protein
VGTAGLHQARARGAPLVDIVVRFREGVSYEAATAAVNALGDDIDLHPQPWYNDPALRLGTATKEALERLFAWQLIRTPLERYDESTGKWDTWPDTYYWKEVSEPKTFPASVTALIANIGCTQPGADDDGQWYE